MKVYVLDNGHLTLDRNLVHPAYNPAMVSNPNPDHELINLPVWTLLIDHPEGKILFDAAIHPDAQGENGRWIKKEQLVAPYFATEEQLLPNRLKQLGVSPEEIKYVVMSHLHSDHSGCLEYFVNATIIVHDDELKNTMKLFAMTKDMGVYCWNDINEWIKAELNWKTISPEEDEIELVEGVKILNYGSGHVWGLLGLHLDLPKEGGIILASDAVYTELNYGPPARPTGFVYDTLGYFKAVENIRDYAEKTNSKVWFGHDANQFETLVKSTEGYYE
ncbi:N-acyl homoserine lactonase family protein [Lysinibacillus endophyticus]|uniref:N-acyl homoserine lactonase family protein n=1 Tax=Ureibacillus endophyticus TaxID=1978490 RepID=UPI00313584C1